MGRLVDRVNALEPDLVLLGGDYVYGNKDYEALGLRRARPPGGAAGTFAVLGNHDYAHPTATT